MFSYTDDELVEIVRRMQLIVADRLREQKRDINLLTYDGSLLDRLAYALVCRTWQPNEYEVVCALRPCMSDRLRSEICEFANENKYVCVGYTTDCKVDFRELRFIEHQCGNVGAIIETRLAGTGGLHITGALIPRTARGDYEYFAKYYQSERSREAYLLPRDKTQTWSTLLLFEGFDATDAFITALALLPDEIGLHHIPSCYLPCFYEFEQHKLRTFVERVDTSIRARLRSGAYQGG
jgi:hypothetical protein